MKRNILMMAAIFAAGTVMSQDLTSKKGELYLPEAGDYAIGIDATPFLNYFGNFIGGDGLNTAPTFGANADEMMSNGFAIYGKQFIDANTAYRGKLRLGFGSVTEGELVADLGANAAEGDEVEDDVKNSYTAIQLGAGYEMRRGNTRLQGVYGAEASIGFGGAKTTNTFGNDIEDAGGSRVTEMKSGSTIMFGVNAFAGVEYFIAPKMSIAGEYTWGLALSSTGNGETTTESLDSDSNGTTDTAETAGGSTFGVDTGRNGASLRFMFHF